MKKQVVLNMYHRNYLNYGKKRPGKKFEEYLMQQNIITDLQLKPLRNETKEYIESELQMAYDAKPMVVDTQMKRSKMYMRRWQT
jgi:TPP-dependent pyruvate/acetoin dehydrogenase alpha subunit